MRGVIVDANLLLLLIIGSSNIDDVARHRRLHPTYNAKDFQILIAFLSSFETVLVTPSTLAELSNLISYSNDDIAIRARFVMRNFVHEFLERYDPSEQVVEDADFPRLGLADAAQLIAAKTGFLLITTDAHLYVAALQRGYEAVNFDYLRLYS